MKYFDNAATSYPKPEAVYQSIDKISRQAGNAGRGAYRASLEASRLLFDARVAIADFLGIKNAERLVFTPGCTYSINVALLGFAFKEGDCVVTTSCEHNAVARTLDQLVRTKGIKVVKLPYKADALFDCADLELSLRSLSPRLCVLTEASNVTGSLIDLEASAAIAHKYNVPLLIDAAQSAGNRSSCVEELGIALWCAAGHKALLGPSGVGLLYVSPDISLEPVICGGTGSISESLEMPQYFPDHLEAGTLACANIGALACGISWISEKGIVPLSMHKRELAEEFLQWARAQNSLQVYGPSRADLQTGTVSFEVKGMDSGVVAEYLDREFDIAVRSGLHCASQAHEALGTLDRGLVRASFGCFNTEEEVQELCQALSKIHKHFQRI